MSYTNPTKGQILEATKDEFLLKYYSRAHHTSLVRQFMNAKGVKPTLDDAKELLENFENEWKDHYLNFEKKEELENLKNEFYRLCVPLRVDVDKALYKFTEGKINSNTFKDIRNNSWVEFEIFVNNNKLELKHMHKKIKSGKSRVQFT